MRRAVAVFLLMTAFPLAALGGRPAGVLDAIAMIDYRHGPHFKVGDWATYQIRASDSKIPTTDYTVTVLIAGEERWWGEECFWFETRTTYPGEPAQATASLLSYSVFEDTLPSRHFSKYLRKYFDGVDGEGRPVQQLFIRNNMEFITRGYEYWEPARQKDTVGVETVEVPKGRLEGLRENSHYRTSVTQQEADSTFYEELTEEIVRWWSDKVPITSLLRIDAEHTKRRRGWLVGESSSDSLKISGSSSGTTALIDYGTGMKSELVADRLQRPLAEQLAPPAKRRAPAAVRKPTRAPG